MEPSKSRSGLIYIVIGVVILILAGLAFYFFVFRQPAEASDPAANPPLINDNSGTTVEVAVADGVGGGDDGDGTQPFTISLSDGSAQPSEQEPITPAVTTPLSAEQIETIFARLPALETDPADQEEFKLPGDPIPPPRPGETIGLPFPLDPEVISPPNIEYGPLEVLRFSPEGAVPIAPTINVTFNQPMAPLGTLTHLSTLEVPVEITPDIPGTWKWVGTRTLRFEFDSNQIDRLPMATEFTVTIPGGTESISGETLAETVSWQFQTPPPSLIQSYPNNGPQDLEPFLFLGFDQRIDPLAVIPFIRAQANGEDFLVSLADEADYAEDETISRMAENAPEGRWMVLKPVSRLPKDASIDITLLAETPSAEGPLTSTEPQTFGFYTYPPLKIQEHGCSWYASGEKCYPLAPFFIRFNNPLDAELYLDEMISIDPILPGASVSISGNTLTIRGASVGNTNYHVRVAESITDIFGQTLGRSENLTFRVGKAEPALMGPDSNFVTLDPSTPKPGLSLYTINHKELDVQIYAVQPDDWRDFLSYVQDYYRTDQPVDPPGELVLDERMKIDADDNQLTEVLIDLSRVMKGDYGHFFVKVRPPKGFFDEDRYWEQVNVWVQVTQIGLDAIADQDELVVWATALKDGSPLQDVEVRSGSIVSTTDAQGIAQIDLSRTILYLVAEQGDDTAILPQSASPWADGWHHRQEDDNLAWFVFDDRSMYRPEEEVHVKGWMRVIDMQPEGDVELLGDQVTAISYQVVGPQGNEIMTGTAEVSPVGGFDFRFTLPENVNLGYASVYLSASGDLSGIYNNSYHHSFQIQEFRRPEFEVSARNESSGPYFVNDEAVVAVEAAYYAGGPLPNADTNWFVSYSATNYTPPNWPGFTFGSWVPWWYYGGFYEADYWYGGSSTSYTYETFNGRTDTTGNHYLRMEFETNGEPRPYSITAEASVMDVNRQSWAGATSLLVHPADLYVGMRTERYYVERNTPIDVELIVTDLDGKAVTDVPITVRAERLEWKYLSGGWQEIAVEAQECAVTSQDEPVVCTFETPIGGKYQLSAVVTDEQERQNRSEMTRWVSGGDLPPSREVEMESAALIPDKENYQPGDTAEILVQSPFSPAEGLLTVTRNGILYTERFTIEESTTTLLIPITDKHYPNINIQVNLVGAAPRTTESGEIVEGAPARPAFASGTLTLNVPPAGRTLAMEISPRETKLAPGESTTIDITLKDAEGNPVPEAKLAVVVVDESILALTNYQMADPLSVFYYTRQASLQSTYGRSSIILVDPALLAAGSDSDMNVMATQMPMGDDAAFATGAGRVAEEAMEMDAPAAEPAADAKDLGGGQAENAPIQVRTDFNPLAVFAPEVTTNASGRASVPVSLPDNLTRYRIMVIAVDQSGKQFGTGESSLTARLPLMVRPSASRFLNFGDQFEIPVVLQNQTDEDMVVEVVAQAGNLELTGEVGVEVTIPANDRVEVRFPGTTESAGTARLQFAAISGKWADAAQVSLPVYTPATTEAFATYGVVDEGAILQPLAPPEGVIPIYGGLEVTTSSTALQSLTDAVLYLVSYPFDCSEQIASRILAIASLRDVLDAFDADGLPSPEELNVRVEADLKELEKLQNYDGGFPYWRRGQDSIPFNTVHVALALQKARQMGYEVPEVLWENTLNYLRHIEDHYPHWYSLRTRQTISAYALYVRLMMDDPDPSKADALLQDAGVEELSLEALAWIWQVLTRYNGYEPQLEAIRRHVSNQAVETAGAANFTTGYDDDAYVLLHSNRRTDAVLLDALISDNPDSDLIPKVVTGLLAHRTKGRWYNTQENVFVLLALERYFRTYENVEPDFVARMWLGEDYIGSSSFEGYNTDSYQLDVPMQFVMDSFDGNQSQDIILQKDGDGRLYYRLGLRYAPDDYDLPPLDMGFVVQREYEGVDNPEDVYQDADGVWHIKAGSRVRVRVTMVADNRRYHVALVDHLPAGVEIINPALAVSETVPPDPSSGNDSNRWWWWWTWYEHQNLRDERVEAFSTLLWDGVYEYTYEVRATMPGTFVVPPAKAEEMYSPEVFGRSASDIVIVE